MIDAKITNLRKEVVWSGFLDGPLTLLNDAVWDLLDLGTGYIDQIAYSMYYASIGTVI